MLAKPRSRNGFKPGVDDPESLDATTIYAHARKARLA
jgi:hypothetical protein